MASKAIVIDDSSASFRAIVQRKFLDEVIGVVQDVWKVLVLDDITTRVISSSVTMFDIMEKRVTIVENLEKLRQPFPDMDVVYFIMPTLSSTEKLLKDFSDPSRPMYGHVHVVFAGSISGDIMSKIQKNAYLVSKIQTFKEITLDFLTNESSLFTLDQSDALSRLYNSQSSKSYSALIGRKLANVCISLNEHPAIRYQGSSSFTRDIAVAMHEHLLRFKNENSEFWYHGDPDHNDRERGQILILDRSFDPLSPLMHEYTYQAMVHDLLSVHDGVLQYKVTGQNTMKEALLGENDELWVELRHCHIAKVIQTIKDRMNDIIQNNAGAALAKNSGADMDITSMAEAVKKLPEYQQTMSRLGQHVAIAQQCMDAFSKLGLMNISQVEQTVSTGFDEDGKEVKGPKLLQLVLDTLPSMRDDQKLRLVIIYIISQRVTLEEERLQLFQAAKLPGPKMQILKNFDKLCDAIRKDIPSAPGTNNNSKATSSSGNSIFSIFRKEAVKHNPSPEGEYADTRHIPVFKVLVEKLILGELSVEKYPTYGATVNTKDNKASAVKSVRKYTSSSRWGAAANNGKGDVAQHYDGGRYFAFVAGGISYAEMRAGYELMGQLKKEVIVGSSHTFSPNEYLNEVERLNSAVSAAQTSL